MSESTVTISVELDEGGGRRATYTRSCPITLGNPIWHSTTVDQAIEIIQDDIRSAIEAVHGKRVEVSS